MTQTQQPEALNLEEFRAKVTRAAREPLLARITELEDVADMAIKRIAELDARCEWEGIHTMPTCDDLIWLYCQDTNTIDGPIAPEPSLEQYGWTHWAYANAPSTAMLSAAPKPPELKSNSPEFDGIKSALTDEVIDEIAESMPDGIQGFMKIWGWRQFARAIEAALAAQAKQAAAAPAVPQGWKLVQIELLERIQESLGSFLSDQGWSQSDMDTADALGGLLAAAPQPPACNQSMQPELATYSAQARNKKGIEQ